MVFKHFTKESVKFLEDIAKNNNKDWFSLNRKRYDQGILVEAKAFVESIGERLSKIDPGISYNPKVDGSIFRIYKDARFHKGAPFKTHTGIIFWHGEERLKVPCFYFHLEPPFYNIGVGMAEYSPAIVAEYRKTLQNPKQCADFIKMIDSVLKNGYNIRGKKRKNLPRGVTGGVGSDEYLKYDCFYINDETPINDDFYSDSFADSLMQAFTKMLPFLQWLVALTERVAKNAEKVK